MFRKLFNYFRTQKALVAALEKSNLTVEALHDSLNYEYRRAEANYDYGIQSMAALILSSGGEVTICKDVVDLVSSNANYTVKTDKAENGDLTMVVVMEEQK